MMLKDLQWVVGKHINSACHKAGMREVTIYLNHVSECYDVSLWVGSPYQLRISRLRLDALEAQCMLNYYLTCDINEEVENEQARRQSVRPGRAGQSEFHRVSDPWR